MTKGITYRRIWRIYYGISKLSGKNGYELSNDGSVYTEPEKIISFRAEAGGSLDGETDQVVQDYADLDIPHRNRNRIMYSGMGSGNPGIRSGKGEHCVSCDF